MKKVLLKLLLVLAAMACFALLALGTLTALFFFPLGFVGLVAGISSGYLPLMGYALFGLITVGLCSFACFTGLIYHLDACIEAIGGVTRPFPVSMFAVTLLSVMATAGIFPAAMDEWFLPACIFADVVHIIYIIVYVHDRSRRKDLCDTSSSSSSDSPQSLPTSGS